MAGLRKSQSSGDDWFGLAFVLCLVVVVLGVAWSWPDCGGWFVLGIVVISVCCGYGSARRQ
jgi:hypothetical protein